MHGIVKDGILIKHEKEKDILRMSGGSWTINLTEINKMGYPRGVLYITEKAKYAIDLEEAMAKGFMRTFLGEEKLVVPLKYWRVKENE